MPEKAIFFDLYQTLINVDASREKEGKETGFREIITPFLAGKGASEAEASLVQQHCNNELNKFYKEHDKELNYHSFPDILTAAFKKHYNLIISDAEMNDLVYEFRKISRGFLHLYEGVREVLANLSTDYTLSIASHTQGMYTERELEELDIKRYFQHRIYSSDIGFKKTSDQFYQYCLKTVGLDPNNCVMVGDNLYKDIYMSQRNRMRTVWIMNPLTKDKKADIQPEASLPLEDINNLPDIIAKIFN
jgi:putative hydrolase of the HAD superfamily